MESLSRMWKPRMLGSLGYRKVNSLLSGSLLPHPLGAINALSANEIIDFTVQLTDFVIVHECKYLCPLYPYIQLVCGLNGSCGTCRNEMVKMKGPQRLSRSASFRRSESQAREVTEFTQRESRAMTWTETAVPVSARRVCLLPTCCSGLSELLCRKFPTCASHSPIGFSVT